MLFKIRPFDRLHADSDNIIPYLKYSPYYNSISQITIMHMRSWLVWCSTMNLLLAECKCKKQKQKQKNPNNYNFSQNMSWQYLLQGSQKKKKKKKPVTTI